MTTTKKYISFWFAVLIITLFGSFTYPQDQNQTDSKILSYCTNPKFHDIRIYWKDTNGEILKSIKNLKTWLDNDNKELLFAMNGGMYRQDNTPQGLFVYNGKTLIPLDTSSGNGNFYLKPNGVFYLTTDKQAVICTTEQFHDKGDVKFATQSGPMLLIDGKIHSAFRQGSINLNIRNGVGIRSDGEIIFAMSKEKINFYDFAKFFLDMGCENALYLDGFVSQTYYPDKNWIQIEGNFGVIIGITDLKN